MATDDCLGQPARTDPINLALSARDFLEAIPAGALFVDEQRTIVSLNAELAHQFGYNPVELIGRTIEILVPTGLRSSHAAIRSMPFGPGSARTMGAGRELQGQRKDGSVFDVEIGLRRLPAENADFILAVVTDRSEHFRALRSEARGAALGLELAHQEIVAREMGHRVKNLMATVAALVSLSARGARTPGEMEDSLRGRILALSSVIDLAFNASKSFGSHSGLSIEDVLRSVLAPFSWTNLERERISLQGPKITLGQRPSEVLALVFHELATNAVKYGALKHPDGTLIINWHQADDRIELCWREVVSKLDSASPPAKGFGTTLLARLIELEFSGRLERQVTPTGWTTCLSIPVTSLGLKDSSTTTAMTMPSTSPVLVTLDRPSHLRNDD